MADEWKRSDFTRRHYQVEGEDLDRAKRIEIIIKLDGKDIVRLEAREPGIVAFVSVPGEQGFHIELVERQPFRYTDIRTLEGLTTESLLPWQLEAMGFSGGT